MMELQNLIEAINAFFTRAEAYEKECLTMEESKRKLERKIIKEMGHQITDYVSQFVLSYLQYNPFDVTAEQIRNLINLFCNNPLTYLSVGGMYSKFITLSLSSTHIVELTDIVCSSIDMRKHTIRPAYYLTAANKNQESDLKNRYIEILISSMSQPDKTAIFLASYFKYVPDDHLEVIGELAKNLHYLPIIENCLNSSLMTSKPFFTKRLIEKCISYNNATLLQFLQKKSPDFYNVVNQMKLSEEQKIKFDQLLTATDSEFLSTSLSHIVNNIARINYEDGLIILSEIEVRKGEDYNFQPILFQREKLSEFFEIVSQAPTPFEVDFIASGSHWVSGRISISEPGVVDFLLIDPSGFIDERSLMPFKEELVKKFPGYKINMYADPTKRQHDSINCAAFAIDDARHLHTVAEYLPPSLPNKNLFTYFREQNKDKNSLGDGATLTWCHLPLSLQRTTQSNDLHTVIIPSYPKNERELPLKKTKAGQSPVTADSLVKKNPDFVSDSQEEKKVNRRIDKMLLEKIANRVFNYLLKTPKEKVLENTRKFTLEGLRARVLGDEKKTHQEYKNK